MANDDMQGIIIYQGVENVKSALRPGNHEKWYGNRRKLLDGVEMELPANRGVMLLNASGVRMDENETDMKTPKMLHDTI